MIGLKKKIGETSHVPEWETHDTQRIRQSSSGAVAMMLVKNNGRVLDRERIYPTLKDYFYKLL